MRASGFGVGYSLALVVPGFYAFCLAGLGLVVPPHVAPAVIVAVAGLVVLLGATAGPESRDVDLGVAAVDEIRSRTIGRGVVAWEPDRPSA